MPPVLRPRMFSIRSCLFPPSHSHFAHRALDCRVNLFLRHWSSTFDLKRRLGLRGGHCRQNLRQRPCARLCSVCQLDALRQPSLTSRNVHYSLPPTSSMCRIISAATLLKASARGKIFSNVPSFFFAQAFWSRNRSSFAFCIAPHECFASATTVPLSVTTTPARA
uniref:Uncharacterized protein n=1 Tax=uncultured marine virus TaxID=186617 RepID=A0A0F7L6P1_9VIRU|nr:hypothetical protein [uncultured marine virus]